MIACGLGEPELLFSKDFTFTADFSHSEWEPPLDSNLEIDSRFMDLVAYASGENEVFFTKDFSSTTDTSLPEWALLLDSNL